MERIKFLVGSLSEPGVCSVRLQTSTVDLVGRLALNRVDLRADQAPEDMARIIAAALAEQNPDMIEKLQQALPAMPRIDIEVSPPALHGLPWELVLDSDEGALGQARLTIANGVDAMRTTGSLFEGRPMLPPFDVLWGLAGPSLDTQILNTPDGLKYFRATVAEEISGDFLKMVTAARSYPILHLQGVEGVHGRTGAAIRMPGAAEILTKAALVSILRRDAPRLLVLEGVKGSFQRLLEVAHRVASATGASTLITEPAWKTSSRGWRTIRCTTSSTTPRWTSSPKRLRTVEPKVALVGPSGSQDGLLLSQAQVLVQGRRDQVLDQVRETLGRLKKAQEEGAARGGSEGYLSRIETAARELEEKRDSLQQSKGCLHVRP